VRDGPGGEKSIGYLRMVPNVMPSFLSGDSTPVQRVLNPPAYAGTQKSDMRKNGGTKMRGGQRVGSFHYARSGANGGLGFGLAR